MRCGVVWFGVHESGPTFRGAFFYVVFAFVVESGIASGAATAAWLCVDLQL